MIIEICPKCGAELRDVILACIPPVIRKECPGCMTQWEQKNKDTKVVRETIDETEWKEIT